MLTTKEIEEVKELNDKIAALYDSMSKTGFSEEKYREIAQLSVKIEGVRSRERVRNRANGLEEKAFNNNI